MGKKNFVLFGNGQVPVHQNELSFLKDAKKIICMDGGTNKLKLLGYSPDYILGDMDSIKSDPSFKNAEKIILKDQSKTDLEKSLDWCRRNNIIKLALIGCSGLRDDHNYVTLLLLLKYFLKLEIIIVTNFSTIHCVQKRKQFNSIAGQTISIIPTIDEIMITTDGLKYSLINQSLSNISQGISNVSLGSEFSVEATEPVWLMINHA
tara:strand:- start:11396 stop:12013 length:618 start_codon:yes stop_codon:yes gene_type:complete